MLDCLHLASVHRKNSWIFQKSLIKYLDTVFLFLSVHKNLLFWTKLRI